MAIIALAVLPLLTPWFMHTALDAAGSADLLRLTASQTHELSDRSLGELVMGPGEFAFDGPDGQPFYDDAERRHLGDARLLLGQQRADDADVVAHLGELLVELGEALAGQGEGARAHNSGEFDGVRAYRRGDPQKTVVWKKAAQSFAAGRDDLVSRDALSAQRQQLWLDHAHCGAPDMETRLSRLTAWVLIAERLELDYGLRLPGREIPPGQGTSHKTRCLEALALC